MFFRRQKTSVASVAPVFRRTPYKLQLARHG